MKTGIDMIEGLQNKLRMMGIPLNGPTSVFCDNQSVVKNTTAPESVLKKHRMQLHITVLMKPKLLDLFMWPGSVVKQTLQTC
jgi:hypothetical protein